MIVPATNGLVTFDTALHGNALMEMLSQHEAMELAKAVELMTVAPYYHEGEAEPRLQRAQKWILEGKVEDLGNGMYTVAGSKPGTTYTLQGDHCECEHAKHNKTRWCYHSVAVHLYQEWQRRLQPLTPLCTHPALPSGPKQPSGLCAHPARAAGCCETHLAMRDAAQEPTTPSPLSQEPPMSANVSTEPLAPSTPVESQALTTPLAASVLEQSLAEWGRQRHVITRYIQEHFVEGTDYYTIKVGGRDTKPTLGKPGAEKFLSLFQLQASFRKDADTWDMLGQPSGLLCYICTLQTRSGSIVGEGRGARDIKQDKNDVNKAIKMAEKSSLIDSILRTGALSDAFTQDLEDVERPAVDMTRPDAASLRRKIVELLRTLGHTAHTREDYERLVVEQTGYTLTEANYAAIVQALRTLLAA